MPHEDSTESAISLAHAISALLNAWVDVTVEARDGVTQDAEVGFACQKLLTNILGGVAEISYYMSAVSNGYPCPPNSHDPSMSFTAANSRYHNQPVTPSPSHMPMPFTPNLSAFHNPVGHEQNYIEIATQASHGHDISYRQSSPLAAEAAYTLPCPPTSSPIAGLLAEQTDGAPWSHNHFPASPSLLVILCDKETRFARFRPERLQIQPVHLQSQRPHLISDSDEDDHDDADLERLTVGVPEARAWSRGRYSNLPSPIIDGVNSEIVLPKFASWRLLGSEFFAALRLVIHAENGKEVDRSLAFVQATPLCSAHPLVPPQAPHTDRTTPSTSQASSPAKCNTELPPSMPSRRAYTEMPITPSSSNASPDSTSHSPFSAPDPYCHSQPPLRQSHPDPSQLCCTALAPSPLNMTVDVGLRPSKAGHKGFYS
ncbi:hypothetical protein CPB84DRAFT_1965961 [Gymnopilus junonius]|uniref:Uncharacterized protein n=1 Tax=Gymnopilus junonius TaxID=109634 RepID=A0A9P5TI95_GYMJU|nr:hypothetical protein CPB84DRAFT_1965961 [Gymnopilus junonius]